MTAGMTKAQQLEAVLRLYRPNVSSGNFMPDVSARGRNKAIAEVAVALGLATPEGLAERFAAIDKEQWDRSQAAIDRMNSERRR